MRPLHKYCPKDGNELSPTDPPECSNCGYQDFINAKSCVAVIVEREGRALLGKKLVNGKEAWDILGGFVGPNESAERAARREVFEEAGLVISHLRYVMSLPDTYPENDEPTLTICFTARAEKWQPTPGGDVTALEEFSPDELPSNLAFPHQSEALRVWKADLPPDSLRLEEYRQCQAGYQYRDQLTQDQFYKIVQLVSILTAVIIAAREVSELPPTTMFWLNFLLCVVGTLGILSLLIDMEANASCKGSLRKRSEFLEIVEGLSYWKRIRDRRMFAEETWGKRVTAYIENWGKKPHEKTSDGSITLVFVWVGRGLCAFWITISSIITALSR